MSRTQHMAKGAAGVAVLALVAAACGSAPTKPAAKSTSTTAASSTTATTASPSGSAPSGSAPSGSTPSGSTPSGSSSTTAAAGNTASFKGCMVTDTGGIDDRSFNASAWKGLQQAHAADPSIHVQYLQSTAQSDYVPNINAFINQHCNLIVTVGFLMADATKAAAKAHPSQHFAIVDNAYSPPIKNVRALLYNTANDAFLGGYLAAGLTKTGKVATYGGENFSTVTIYMDGFWDGVQYYNKKHHKSVQVLGWNEKTQKGTFVGSFTDQAKAKNITVAFIQQGADIIFPVAGSDGLGSVAAVKQQPKGQDYLLWVDTDGCVSDPSACQYFYASVTKGIVASVKQVTTKAKAGSFTGGNFIGTFKNNGIALIYGKVLGSKIPSSLKSEISQIKQGITSGAIPVPSPSKPKS